MPLKRFVDRPPGTSSRLTRVSKATSHWVAANRLRVELPAEIDVAHINESANSLEWFVVAKIDLVDESPSLVSVEVKGFPQLDTHHLQSFFRWLGRTHIGINNSEPRFVFVRVRGSKLPEAVVTDCRRETH